MALVLSSGVLGNWKAFIGSRKDGVRELKAHVLEENNPVRNIDRYINEKI